MIPSQNQKFGIPSKISLENLLQISTGISLEIFLQIPSQIFHVFSSIFSPRISLRNFLLPKLLNECFQILHREFSLKIYLGFLQKLFQEFLNKFLRGLIQNFSIKISKIFLDYFSWVQSETPSGIAADFFLEVCFKNPSQISSGFPTEFSTGIASKFFLH